MKRVLAFALILFSVALCFHSYQKAPELTITSNATIELGVDGSSGSITFMANRDWTANSSDSWVSISPSSGKASDGTVTISVRCSANTTYDDRTATVTIPDGGFVKDGHGPTAGEQRCRAPEAGL